MPPSKAGLPCLCGGLPASDRCLGLAACLRSRGKNGHGLASPSQRRKGGPSLVVRRQGLMEGTGRQEQGPKVVGTNDACRKKAHRSRGRSRGEGH